MILILMIAAAYMFSRKDVNRSEIGYDFFWQQLSANNIASVEVDGQTMTGHFKKVPEPPPKVRPPAPVNARRIQI